MAAAVATPASSGVEGAGNEDTTAVEAASAFVEPQHPHTRKLLSSPSWYVSVVTVNLLTELAFNLEEVRSSHVVLAQGSKQ